MDCRQKAKSIISGTRFTPAAFRFTGSTGADGGGQPWTQRVGFRDGNVHRPGVSEPGVPPSGGDGQGGLLHAGVQASGELAV